MTSAKPAPRADKQRDLLDGALALFARDGYSRASIDAIAAHAGVSTRTIYNHYDDKAGLFQAVIVDSARRTARHQIALVQRLLADVTDVETALVRFGLAWATPQPDAADHFALVRQIAADAGHLPPAALSAWQDAGPRPVRAEIAAHLRRLADHGQLTIDDELLAATHLVALTAGSIGSTVAPEADDPQRRTQVVHAGITVFLAAYRNHRP